MDKTEKLTNILENTACRIAQLQSGRVAPHHIISYLPVSLAMACDGLSGMVDGAAVSAESNDGIQEYLFSEYTDKPSGGSELCVSTCVSCSDAMDSVGVLCAACTGDLRNELAGLAEKTGWPAQAVYEHEILYLAAKENGPVSAETLAGSSNYTLRSMKRKLAVLAESHFIKTEPGSRAGTVRYVFPSLTYPQNRYRENQRVIRSYPASLMEDVELRMVRVLVALGCIFLGMLVLAFWGFPFVLLVPAFLVVAPITALFIWRRKNKIEEI